MGWSINARQRTGMSLGVNCHIRFTVALLSTPVHKYDHVCGEGFLAQTRRERRAYPSAVCKERATTSGPKRTAARRVASLFGSGFVAPRSQPHFGMLPRRASPRPQIDATNVVVVMIRSTSVLMIWHS